jgi:hypothetical protein
MRDGAAELLGGSQRTINVRFVDRNAKKEFEICSITRQEDCGDGYRWLKVSEAPQRIEGSDREEEGIEGGNPQTSAHAGYVRTCSDSENTTARSPPHLIIPFAQERPKAPHTLNRSAMIDALVGEDPAYGVQSSVGFGNSTAADRILT